MKRRKKVPKKLDKNSLLMRRLVRKAMPPPSIRMKSKKDYNRKNKIEKE